MQPHVTLNNLWVVIAGMLVFFMGAGFALLEAGLCRAKNAVNILSKNFIVFGFGMVGYWSFGYALMFGAGNAIVGTEGYFLIGLPRDVGGGLHLHAMFFFQLCFAVTAATIVSGAVAERVRLQAFIMFSIVISTLIYPIVGHWIWSKSGWLAQKSFADFAGGTVVHSVGGWSALTGAAVLGPRIGKYDKDGNPRPIPGHNLTAVALGGFILWLGWFGFNGGAQLAFDSNVPDIIAATALAGSFGTVASTIWSWVRLGAPDLTFIINGMLGGLVGITASCNAVPMWAAAMIGCSCGMLVIESVMLIDRLRIDDPVGAISVHLVCGIFGTVLAGVFMEDTGLIATGSMAQLGVQVQGVTAVGIFVGGTSLLVWLAMRATMGLRVAADEEVAGLDQAEHGMDAYPPADDASDERYGSP